MRIWKVALIGAIAGGALIFTVAHHGANTTEHPGGTALAADKTNTKQTPPPADTVPASLEPDKENGWGPFRTTDW